jgi:hypothetical protein
MHFFPCGFVCTLSMKQCMSLARMHLQAIMWVGLKLKGFLKNRSPLISVTIGQSHFPHSQDRMKCTCRAFFFSFLRNCAGRDDVHTCGAHSAKILHPVATTMESARETSPVMTNMPTEDRKPAKKLLKGNVPTKIQYRN